MTRNPIRPEEFKTPGDGPLRYLLTAYLFGDISEAGKKEVEKHLAESPESRAELEELRATLETVEDALAKGEEETQKYSFEARRLERVLSTSPTRGWWHGRGFQTLAAMVCIGVFALFFVSSRGSKRAELLLDSAAKVGIANVSQSRPRLSDRRPNDWGAQEASSDFSQPRRGRWLAERRANAPASLDEKEGRLLARADLASEGESAVEGWNESPSEHRDARSVREGRTRGVRRAALSKLAKQVPESTLAKSKEGDDGKLTYEFLARKPVISLRDGMTLKNGKASSRDGAQDPSEESSADNSSIRGQIPSRQLRLGVSPAESSNGAFGAGGGAGGAYGGLLMREGGNVASSALPRALPPVATAPTGVDDSAPAPTSEPRRNQRPTGRSSSRGPRVLADTADTELRAGEKSRLGRQQGQRQYDPIRKREMEKESLKLPAKQRLSQAAAANRAAAANEPSGEPVAQRKVDEVPPRPRRAESSFGLQGQDMDQLQEMAKTLQERKVAAPKAQNPPAVESKNNPLGIAGKWYDEKNKNGRTLRSRGTNPGSRRAADAAVVYDVNLSIPGEDGIIGTPDDRMALTGGGSDGQFQGDEVASQTKKERFAGRTNPVHERMDRPQTDPGRTLEEQEALEEHLYGFADLPAARKLDEVTPAAPTDIPKGSNSSEAQRKVSGGTVFFRGDNNLASVGKDEHLARNFRHYQRLDPKLTWEQYTARQLEIPAPVVGDEGLGQEGFKARYGVNPFVDTRRDHLSTFAMDVDTASFTRTRDQLRGGKLPNPASVRVEEFVNYFRTDYPAAPNAVFSVFSEGGPSLFGDGVDLLKVTVKARELHPGERRPVLLTFAIDTSGSMFVGGRLGLVQGALAKLLASLGPEDRVGIVAYSSQAYLVIPHTPARERERLLGALQSLTPSGASNVEAGLELAYRVADDVFQPRGMNRVVLCSDGVATAGARGPAEIVEKVKVYARRGIYLSAVGFGRQRYDDHMMERLANEGNGRYDFVSNLDEAARIFQANLPQTLQVLAQDAKIQVDFDPKVVANYRLLGYENRAIKDEQFRDDKVDAGEVGPGSTVTALYEIQRRAGAHGALGRVFIRFRDTATSNVDELDFPLPPGILAARTSETSDFFRFVACAAEAAELLRASYWARNGSYQKIKEVLMQLSPEFRARPDWRELVQVVQQAQILAVQEFMKP